MTFFASLHRFSDVALLLLRLALGTVFLVHGLPKRHLWKAQPSPQMPAGMLRNLRILSIAEPAGALGLIFGFLTQLAALGLCVSMLGALQCRVTLRRPSIKSDRRHTTAGRRDGPSRRHDAIIRARNLERESECGAAVDRAAQP